MGAVVWRLDLESESESQSQTESPSEGESASNGATKTAYIAAIAVDARARRSKHGEKLVREVARRAQSAGARAVRVHVHVANEDALSFYAALGFRRVKVCERYYPRLRPPDAALMEMQVGGENKSESGSGAAAAARDAKPE